MDLSSVFSWGEGDSYSVGPLQTANLNHFASASSLFFWHDRQEQE
jgi:hypothetical protein